MQPTKRETDEAGLRPTLLVDGDASPRADDGADAGGAILTLLRAHWHRGFSPS
jgi:hypothetical protein